MCFLGRFWIWLFAWLTATGWTLSWWHQLNARGYAISLLLFTAAFGFLQGGEAVALFSNLSEKRFPRRFRRPLPALFLSLTVLVFVGGMLYAPTNFDALTYRLTRMLSWLSAGQWFWIPTFNERMNYSGAGWEWAAMPLLALTHSDRGMFLINALGFLLMPGLLFSIFRQLGVAHKVAWTWMWLLPLAYGYLSQAGSIGNDLTGTVFCLLSVYFGLRARRSQRASDIWCALLAAALLTGVKLSNLPLALPCLVAVWSALGQLRKNVAGSLAVAVLCVVVSALPIMALNHMNTGSWNGDPDNKYEMQIKNPFAAFCGNSFLLAEQSLAPAVLPASNEINQWLTTALPAWLKTQFPRLNGNKINELQGEEGAGLGLGITLPLLVGLGVTLRRSSRFGSRLKVRNLFPVVVTAGWIAMVFYMVKIGSESGARLLLPYYPLAIVPFLLLPAQKMLSPLRAWRIFLLLLALLALPLVVLSISRPLWPAQSVSLKLAQAHPESKMLQRLASTYTTYAVRNDVLAPLRSRLPGDAVEVGFIAGENDTDYSLWRPFGQRKVKYLRHESYHFLQAPEQTEWVLVKQNIWQEMSSVPLPEWAQGHHAKIALVQPITTLVSWGSENWYLLHFEKASGSAATSSH